MNKYVSVPSTKYGQRVRARTHCVNGHKWTKATRYVNPTTGSLCCRRCKAESCARIRRLTQ